ncbi:MAG: extracellular solute-binding protein [Chloroflexi bacterium]|nr:extracellular solute-binding protein [Chloroflexota bacterium]
MLGTAMAAGGAASFAACRPPWTGPSDTPAAAPITVSYGTDWTVAGGNQPRAEIMDKALTLFAQKYPNITLNTTDLAGGNYRDKLAAMFAAGTQDDVISPDVLSQAHYRDVGALVDLAPYVKTAKIDLKTFTYVDPVWSVGTKLYYLPFQVGGNTWYFNKTLFQRMGVPLPAESWTWTDWADSAKKLSKPSADEDGQAQYGLLINLANPQGTILPFLVANGGHHISADFKQTLLNTLESLEALRWVADRLLRDRSLAPPPASGGKRVNFDDGAVGMEVGGSKNIGARLTTLAGKFEWDLMHMPKSPRTGKRAAIFNQGPNGITVRPTGSTARVEAAFTVVQFLAGKDVQLLIARDRANTPALRELVTTSPFADPPPANMNVFAKMLDSVLDFRYFSLYGEFTAAYTAALNDIWNGKVSVETGAQQATAAGNAVLAKAGGK